MYKFSRFESSLMTKQYQMVKSPSPVEGSIMLHNKAKEIGDRLIKLNIMTDQIPPESVRIAAAMQALKGGYIKNSLPLRDRVSKFYEKNRKVKYDPESEIFITAGSQLGIDSTFKLIVEPGDEIILFEPDYATYEPMIKFYGGKAISIALLFNNNGWSLDKESFSRKISNKTKMVVLSNPNNPTGYMYKKEDLDFLVNLVQKNNCWLLSDEIWSLLLLSEKKPYMSIAIYESIKDRLVTVFSASKTFGMSGYRTGVIMGPPEFISAISQVIRFSVQSAPTIGQIAFLEALSK